MFEPENEESAGAVSKYLNSASSYGSASPNNGLTLHALEQKPQFVPDLSIWQIP